MRIAEIRPCRVISSIETNSKRCLDSKYRSVIIAFSSHHRQISRETGSHIASVMHPRHAQGRAFVGIQLKIWVAGWGVSLVVFETVEVLVPLLANVALVWLLLFHSHGARIWCLGVGVDNREGSVAILMESLIVMTVLAFR